MRTVEITTQQHEAKGFKIVLINGKPIGVVMADDSMTPKECYEQLKADWDISAMEVSHNRHLDRLGI